MTIVSIAAVTAFAEEHAVKEKDVPPAALAAVAKKYPGARRLGYAKETENGATVYEVQILDGKVKIDVDVTAEGRSPQRSP